MTNIAETNAQLDVFENNFRIGDSFVGKPKRIGVWRTLLIMLHSGDYNPIHWWPPAAHKENLPGVVMHGCAHEPLLSGFLKEVLPNGSIARLSGKTKICSNVRIGDLVKYSAKVMNVQLRRGTTVVTFDAEAHVGKEMVYFKKSITVILPKE
ncbi:MAG: MaoC family dehydratase [Candidatus Pacebacteria bacterium]|nr:MaoC family dehydratase [Candidatus Paceibacterota bacterium]